jgi:hypothetical protein
MAVGFHHETAKIYQLNAFSRGRKISNASEGAPSSVIKFPETVQYAVVDTCWYHQEAVADDGKATN